MSDSDNYESDSKYDDETEAIREFGIFKENIEQIKTNTEKKMNMEEFKEALSLYYDIITKINDLKYNLLFDINNQTELKSIIDYIFDFYCSYPKFKKMLIYYLLKNIPDDEIYLTMNKDSIINEKSVKDNDSTFLAI